MGGPTEIFGEGYDGPVFEETPLSLGLPAGLKAAPDPPPTLSEQFESLPSRSSSLSSVPCNRLRTSSMCASFAKLNQPAQNGDNHKKLLLRQHLNMLIINSP